MFVYIDTLSNSWVIQTPIHIHRIQSCSDHLHNILKSSKKSQKDHKSKHKQIYKSPYKKEGEPRTNKLCVSHVELSLRRSKSRLQYIFKILLGSSILPLLILNCQCSQSLVLDEIRVSKSIYNSYKL